MIMASPVPNCEGTQFKTGAKQAEIARKGGIASGEAKRRKKTMKELLREMLEEKAPHDKDGRSYMELATLGLIKGAVKGNSKNYEVMLETLGEYNNSEDKKAGIIVDLVEALKNAKNDK